jgi:hypothetical protein
MRRRSPVLPLFALVLCAAVVYLYFTPYLAVRKMQAAAESGDSRTLERMVDFPALRTSLKDEVRTAAARQVTGERRSRAAAVGGAVVGMVAGAVTDPVVNAVVTPTGVGLLLQGRRPGESPAEEGRWRKEVRISRGYEGTNRFVVRYLDRQSGEERLTLVLRREGLDWRLTGVRLGGGR